ncbi:MAG: hypothetical protein IJR17_06270 [Clostridia bacterium]|nr:hypothetical protein [Clostridia bacterium]
MNWGLTIFERRRMEKMVLDHPYFDAHGPLLSRRALRRVLRQGTKKTGHQVVHQVQMELGLPLSPLPRRRLIDALGDGMYVPSFRRTVAIAILILAFVAVLTLTEPGRAMAAEWFEVIIEYRDGSLQASSGVPVQQEEVNFLTLPDDIGTPREVAKYLSCPIYVTDDPMSECTLDVEENTLLMIARYRLEGERSYVIFQTVYAPGVAWGFGTEAATAPIQRELPNGLLMELNLSNDGTVHASGFGENYILHISISDGTIEELTDILSRVYPLE